jgi:hypothetical protein
MEIAKQNYEQLNREHQEITHTFYEQKHLLENYKKCFEMCKKGPDCKLCLYDTTSTRFSITTIEILDAG